MSRIAFIPPIEKEEQLVDLQSRAAWFFSFLPVTRILFPLANESLRTFVPKVAGGMDPKIGNRLGYMGDKMELVITSSLSDLDTLIQEADIILQWKTDLSQSIVTDGYLKCISKGKRLFHVDSRRTRQEGSFYIEAGLSLLSTRDNLLSDCARKFSSLNSALGKFDRSYVLATGPSISRYAEFDYSGSFRIICNSIILDNYLMHKVRPHVLVFADPIFHFGPSEYAATFREKLRDACDRYEFTICMPFKYYPLFTTALPELADRTIGIPFEKNQTFNFDLGEHFSVRATANILSFLMIPLATTFARNVYVLGCDGRPLRENSYFWRHNPTTQINDKMSNIREIHPGFFAIDYNDYYLDHCKTLEQQIEEAEKCGHSIRSLGPSHIPVLAGRQVSSKGSDGCQESVPEVLTSIPKIKRLISVNPDADSLFGHYLHYERTLGSAIKELGLSHIIAGPKEVSPSILSAFPHLREVFSMRSSNLFAVNPGLGKEAIDTFSGELDKFLSTLDPSEPTILFMYCGSLEIAEAVASILEKHRFVCAIINLFWLSWSDAQSSTFKAYWRTRFPRLLSQKRLSLFVPCREVAEDLRGGLGIELPILPHPSTSFCDSSVRKMFAEIPAEREGREVVVFFPGNLRVGKGLKLTIECIEALAAAGPANLKIVMRRPSADVIDKGLENFLDDFPDRVEFTESFLSEEKFGALLRRADLLVLPYTPERFRNRTSGLLIDGILVGVPSVVIEGTWLATTVREYDAGVVSRADGGALAAVVMDLVKDLDAAKDRVRRARGRYHSENSWENLCKLLMRVGDDAGREEEGVALETPESGDASMPTELKLDFQGIAAFGDASARFGRYRLSPPCSQHWVACIYAGSVRAGRVIQGEVRFRSDRRAKVRVSLCRHGRTAFEETSLDVCVSRGVNLVKILHRFENSHAGLRIQIGTLDRECVISKLSGRVSPPSESDDALSAGAVARKERVFKRIKASNPMDGVREIAYRIFQPVVFGGLGLVILGLLFFFDPGGIGLFGGRLLLIAGNALVALFFIGYVLDGRRFRKRIRALKEAQGEARDVIGRKMQRISYELQCEREERTRVLEARTREIESQAREVSALKAGLNELSSKAEATERHVQLIDARSLSLDLMSVLRALRPLWFDLDPLEVIREQPSSEHGHGLMMALLVDQERGCPGTLAGKTLTEIGTTREHDFNQSSSEKFAAFTAMMGMKFVTVDMDPENGSRVEKVIRYLNPLAKVVTAKGEDYLAHADSIEFVYLDAFDCDHGRHSEERQARYREILETTINNETCWKMHEECARAIITKMAPGGIVVIDDTWVDSDGKFAGKGALAVPLLMSNNFSVLMRLRNAIALRRMSPAERQRASEK